MTTQNNHADIRISEETVTTTFAEVSVNGRSLGKKAINGGPSLKEVATKLAAEHGIKSFTVTLDGAAVTSPAVASAPIPNNSSVGVQAKDARGAAKKPTMGEQEQDSLAQADGSGVPGDKTEADEENSEYVEENSAITDGDAAPAGDEAEAAEEVKV